MNIEKPSFKRICLMHMQALTNFPYIEKDFDAITDYELLCKVVDYLNQVIQNENTQNESIISLYDAFVELKDYVDNFFDNLDVQDEINTKLDEMVEDGTFDTIINQTLFTNINNKIDKRIVYTSEFRETYEDDHDLLEYCLSGDFSKVYIDNDLTINEVVNLPSNIEIFSSSTITGNKTRIFLASNKENITINGGKYIVVDNDAVEANSYQPILISNCKDVIIENCEISTNSSDGLYIGIAYSETVFNNRTQNIKVENCIFKNCARNGIVLNSGDNILVNNCRFENINTYSPGHGIDVEFEYRNTSNELYITNLNVENCYAKNCNTLINIFPTTKMSNKSNINVNNCICDDVKIIIHGPSNNVDTLSCTININNIIFKNMTSNHNIRIADFREPNYLYLGNIITNNYDGNVPETTFEFGDIFIDGSNYLTNNIILNNISTIKNSRNQTIQIKDAFNIDIKVYNTKIECDHQLFLPFGCKFYNCTGSLNCRIAGSNAWFKVMKLNNNTKYNFNVFSNEWLNFDITTGDTDSLTITKGVGNSYITKGRIVIQNNVKYLELFTSRIYSFPFVYDIKTIENGVDKKPSDAVAGDVSIEVNVT